MNKKSEQQKAMKAVCDLSPAALGHFDSGKMLEDYGRRMGEGVHPVLTIILGFVIFLWIAFISYCAAKFLNSLG